MPCRDEPRHEPSVLAGLAGCFASYQKRVNLGYFAVKITFSVLYFSYVALFSSK